MNNKVYKRKVNKQDFYYIYLKTLNGHLSLTNRELEVLVEICKIQAQNINKGYSDEQLSKIVFSTSSRKLMRSHLNISSFNLNNIIKVLKDKKILLDMDYGYKINPNVFVSDQEDQSINFKIEILHDK